MPNKKITQLPPSTTPLTGAELLPVVQSSATVQTSVNSLGPGIGYTPAGAGAVATTVQAKLRQEIKRTDYNTETNYLTAAASLSTGGFWMDESPQPVHWRMADRVFIGAAASQTTGNKFPIPYAGTFLTTQMGAFWMERGATTLSVSDYGEFGGVFAARSSDKSKSSYYGDATIGVLGIATNDYVSSTQFCWGAYFEANRASGAATTYGQEIAVKNLGTNVINYPSLLFPSGATIGIWLAGGGDASYYGAPANPSTCAILIGNNSTTWNKGIVFDQVGITGTDGVTGTGVAIALGMRHVISWSNASNQEVSSIFSTGTLTASRVGLQFVDGQLWVTKAGALGLNFDLTSGTANYFQLSSSAAASPLNITASGTDTDIDIRLAAKGAGVIRFGTLTANADAPVTGYITIKDAGGTTRKLAVIA